MVSPQDWGSTSICRLVWPRRHHGWECFQKEPGHESEFPVAQDSSEPLKLWVGVVRRAYAGRAVGVIGVSSDKACDLISCSVAEEDIVEVRDQSCFGGDARLEQSKYGSLRRWLVYRN